MDRKTTFLAVLAGLALAASATLAFAGDRGSHEVWRTERCGCVVRVHHVVRHVRHVQRVEVRYYALPAPPPVIIERPVVVRDEGVRLSDTFFADSGGVGPVFADYGGGGGGGYVIEQGGASAFAGAHASASASANVSIAFRGRGRMPWRPMPHGGGGCGCSGGGGGGHMGKW